MKLSQSGRDWALELPTDGIRSLMKVLAEAQQRALPRAGGNPALRVVRKPVTWSLERDMADEGLALVLFTEDGFEWCSASETPRSSGWPSACVTNGP